MTKVFLKFNRTESFALVCLVFWLELFKNYELFLVCDLFNPARDPIPDFLEPLLKNRNIKIINSDYSLGQKYAKMCKSRKQSMVSANLTCFNYLTKKDQQFWIIDADDTLFLHKDYDYIRSKLKQCEDLMMSESLDAFSLDFYREYNDTWTFGVCLLNAKINWQKVETITDADLLTYNMSLNGDSMFDILGRKGIFKLKNFVIEGIAFQHVVNNFRKMNVGVYYWKDRKLWDTPLKDDVISL
jgi:hypothetical protein